MHPPSAIFLVIPIVNIRVFLIVNALSEWHSQGPTIMMPSNCGCRLEAFQSSECSAFDDCGLAVVERLVTAHNVCPGFPYQCAGHVNLFTPFWSHHFLSFWLRYAESPNPPTRMNR